MHNHFSNSRFFNPDLKKKINCLKNIRNNHQQAFSRCTWFFGPENGDKSLTRLSNLLRSTDSFRQMSRKRERLRFEFRKNSAYKVEMPRSFMFA